MTHFVHTFFGRLHFVHTFRGAQKTLCELFLGCWELHAHFSWPESHLVHTFRGSVPESVRTSFAPCAHFRPPTGCPVPPGAPSARPAWIKLCGLCCIYSWHQGQRRRPRRAASARPQAGPGQNDAATPEALSMQGGDHAPFSLRLKDHS